jgi:ABC-type uncharacterized transport system ATPase subunit
MSFELHAVTKRYGALVANDAVSLSVARGEVLALLGENGAGKSTAMKILYGFEHADGGEIRIDGAPVVIDSPRAARAHGIGMVFQHFSLIDALSVRDNLALGASDTPFWRGFAPRPSRAEERLLALAPGFDVTRRAGALSVGEQQLVELARVLAQGAQLLIFDEPTSVLTRAEAEGLWRRIRELSQAGHAIVLITHKLEDVAACADRVLVLRGGRVAGETSQVHDRELLVRMMVGDAPMPPRARSKLSASTEPRIRARAVRAEHGGRALTIDALDVGAGEVLGVAGVTGNGQEGLARLLAGVLAPSAGTLELRGCAPPAPPVIAFLPEQPRVHASAGELPLLENFCALELASLPLWLDLASQRARAAAALARFDVRPSVLELPAAALSGGNLQKLVAARELSRKPDLVIACYPTMGLDVKAARCLLDAMSEAAEQGAAVVLICEDLDVLLERATRMAVLARGRLVLPAASESASRDALGALMSGASA